MIIINLNPTPLDKELFKLSNYKCIPTYSGCYVLTTFDNLILYIGQAKNLFLRFQQHLENPEKTNVTEIGKAYWFYYLKHDANDLNELERTWLNQYEIMHGVLPILNKIRSPVN